MPESLQASAEIQAEHHVSQSQPGAERVARPEDPSSKWVRFIERALSADADVPLKRRTRRLLSLIVLASEPGLSASDRWRRAPRCEDLRGGTSIG